MSARTIRPKRERKILAERSQKSQSKQGQSEEGLGLFDVLLLHQNARRDETPSPKQSNWARALMRRLRESVISGQPQTAEQPQTADKPATSDVSHQLALSWLSKKEENGPY
jgi:hypothetical protein